MVPRRPHPGTPTSPLTFLPLDCNRPGTKGVRGPKLTTPTSVPACEVLIVLPLPTRRHPTPSGRVRSLLSLPFQDLVSGTLGVVEDPSSVRGRARCTWRVDASP